MDTTERLHFHFSLSCVGEGNGNPLQCSCLENPRDGRAWWAAAYGVAQSRTRLKQRSSSSRYIHYQVDTSPLSGTYFANIFSWICRLSFILFNSVFQRAEIFNLLINFFPSWIMLLVLYLKINHPTQYHLAFLLC